MCARADPRGACMYKSPFSGTCAPTREARRLYAGGLRPHPFFKTVRGHFTNFAAHPRGCRRAARHPAAAFVKVFAFNALLPVSFASPLSPLSGTSFLPLCLRVGIPRLKPLRVFRLGRGFRSLSALSACPRLIAHAHALTLVFLRSRAGEVSPALRS